MDMVENMLHGRSGRLGNISRILFWCQLVPRERSDQTQIFGPCTVTRKGASKTSSPIVGRSGVTWMSEVCPTG